MGTYYDEMYKFIASKDNFEVAAEIYNLFPSVKERMIKGFWESVKEKIDELNTDKKWIVEYVPEESISIYKEGWEACVSAVNIDKSVSYGICFDQDKFDQKLYNEDHSRKILADHEAVNWMKKGKAWWFYIEDAGDNFQEIATLKKTSSAARGFSMKVTPPRSSINALHYLKSSSTS